MPLMTVDYPEGALSHQQKDALAEELTRVVLEIEGGADTPATRSIAWVRFRSVPREDWYVGGTSGDTYVSVAGKFLVELNVPEGSMDQGRKSAAHRAITESFLRVTGTQGTEGAGRSVWVQIFEWPEGHLAAGGRTASIFGIAKFADIPLDGQRMTFTRAYFDAKDRWYDAHNFPKEATGRALIRG